MKKLLAVAVAGIMMLAVGCMKIGNDYSDNGNNKLPDYVYCDYYADALFYTPSTSFIIDSEGLRSVKISGGSREAYENPENTTASFVELTFNLGSALDWEGEYEWKSSSTAIGLFELKSRVREDYTGIVETDEFLAPIYSGSAVITHIEGNKYNVSFSGAGRTDDGLPSTIMAKIENTVTMVAPEGE